MNNYYTSENYWIASIIGGCLLVVVAVMVIATLAVLVLL